MHRPFRVFLLIVGLCCVVAASAFAKDQAKTPPKKDTPTKTTSCQKPSSGKVKSADKAFNAMDCYIRG